MELGDGYLKQFIDDSKSLTPEERGNLLQKSEGIINTHKEVASEGQTNVSKSNYNIIKASVHMH